MNIVETLETRTVLSMTAVPIGVASAGGNPSPSEFVEVGSYVVFAATSASAGRELHSFSGGRAALLKDINAGPADASPGLFAATDGVLFFAAVGGGSGADVWRTDGTAGGTRKLIEMSSDSPTAVMRLSVVRDRLIVLDDTKGRVASYNFDGGDLRVLDVLPTNRKILYFETGPTGVVYGVEDKSIQPWDEPHEQLQSDGVSSSTVFSRDFLAPYYERGALGSWIATGGAHSTTFRNATTGGSWTLNYTAFVELANGRMLFSDGDVLAGGDATLRDVTIVRDFGHIANLTTSGDTAYFSVGAEIWRTDGTSTGTYRLTAVAGRIPGLIAQIGDLRMVGGTLFFTTEGEGVNATGRDLRYMKAEIGAAIGTVVIPRDVTNAAPHHFASMSGSLYFAAQTSTGAEPFRLDVASSEVVSGVLSVWGTAGNDSIVVESKRINKKWRLVVTVNGRVETYVSNSATIVEVNGAD